MKQIKIETIKDVSEKALNNPNWEIILNIEENEIGRINILSLNESDLKNLFDNISNLILDNEFWSLIKNEELKLDEVKKNIIDDSCFQKLQEEIKSESEICFTFIENFINILKNEINFSLDSIQESNYL